VGTLFAVLGTSSIGVFAPILLNKLPFQRVNTWIFTILKQFGTGIIVSTAFVHLYTHAYLMFTNPCLGRLHYEATTSAIVMAGIFLAFLFEYIGHRIVISRQPSTPKDRETSLSPVPSSQIVNDSETKHPLSSAIHNFSHSHGPTPLDPNTPVSVLVMESGILFHSILIGLTLIVAPNSFYTTLLIVIIFHQFFEGLALGARISTLSSPFWPTKLLMASAFALITPLGMAIGLGVIHNFNGNDRSTIVAIGTLDALSAGILVWVGVVDMWARDWVVHGGEMVGRDASIGKVGVGLFSLIVGFVLMSLLGKWA
jgi:solute carrier family 39 (zinc transporter), member 1/2/3